MTSVTLYGGVGEIGGNKVLVESGENRILLDFGSRMGYESEYFSEFVNPRTNTALRDRLTIGALPRVDGIYRDDLIRPGGIDSLAEMDFGRVLKPNSFYFGLHGVKTYDEYVEENGKPYVNALFVSHSHLDHTGSIGYLDHRIPLFCSVTSAKMIEAIDNVTNFKSEALTTKGRDIWTLGKTATFPGTPKIDKTEIFERECHTMADGGVVEIAPGFKVEMYEVDHSVPGAASFVVEIGNLRLLYTGDIRFHGSHPMTIEEYTKKVGRIDVMLCEGTRVASRNIMYEENIGERLREQFNKVRGMIFVDFAWKDTTRFETIRDAAADAGRTMVINARLAYLLNVLGIPRGDNVKVFLKRRVSCLYSPSDYTSAKHELGLKTDWSDGRDMTHYENGIVAEQIRERPENYVLHLSFYDMGQLFDLADSDGLIPNSHFIRAQCEPFSDEMEIDEERLINWLDRFGIGYILKDAKLPPGCDNPKCKKIHMTIRREHVSGHASRPELVELIGRLAPKVLFPMHTEEEMEFHDISTELYQERGVEIQVEVPKMDGKYSLW